MSTSSSESRSSLFSAAGRQCGQAAASTLTSEEEETQKLATSRDCTHTRSHMLLGGGSSSQRWTCRLRGVCEFAIRSDQEHRTVDEGKRSSSWRHAARQRALLLKCNTQHN
eukprot:4155834-Prymnesium_polylepis.2